MKKLQKNAAMSVILLAALLCTACGDTGNTPDVKDSTDGTDEQQTEDTTPETSLLDSLENKDFGGRTFTLLDANGAAFKHVNIPAESENGDIINDALYKRGVFIEDKYKINIEYISSDSSNGGCTQLKNSVQAGDHDYDMIISSVSNGLDSIALNGVLANMLDMPDLTLDSSWWSHYMYENMQLGGKMYYTTGDISPTMYQMPACVYVNRDLADDYNITTDFYGLVTSGKWTVDELYNATKDLNKDLNNDGKISDTDDFFGFAPQMQSLTTQSLLTGCGVNLCTLSADKQSLSIDFSGDRTAQVVEKLQQLVPNDIVMANGQSVDTGKVFIENRAISIMHFVEKSMETLRDMESDYYILPVPKFDENQDGYRSFVNSWITAFVGFPSNADLEFSGFVAEALARYSYEKIRPLAFDITYKGKVARDEQSAEMLDIIFDNVYLDFNAVYKFGGMLAGLDNVVIKDAPLASTVASTQSAAEKAIETFAQNWIGE